MEMISHQMHWSIFHRCFKLSYVFGHDVSAIRSLLDLIAFWLEVSCPKLSSSLPFYSTNYRSFIKNHEKVTKLYQLLKSWRRRSLTNENVAQCRPKVRIHRILYVQKFKRLWAKYVFVKTSRFCYLQECSLIDVQKFYIVWNRILLQTFCLHCRYGRTDAGPIFKSEFHHECFLRHHAKKEMDLWNATNIISNNSMVCKRGFCKTLSCN